MKEQLKRKWQQIYKEWKQKKRPQETQGSAAAAESAPKQKHSEPTSAPEV